MSEVLQFPDSLLMYGKAKVAAQSDNFTQTGMVRSKTNVSREVELVCWKNWAIALNRSGKILLLGSTVPQHLVSRWTMSSAGAR